jgi:imidazolonepropionase-like amidohydrolase
VRAHAEREVDLIKVMASGGMSTPGTSTVAAQFSDTALQLIVREAHAAGLPVTAHAHWLAAIEQAVAAGVDGIEHCSCLTPGGVDLPDALVDILAERRVAVSGVIPPAPAEFMQFAPPAVRQMMAASGQTPELVREWRAGMIRRLVDAGVPVVTGLDAGLNPWLAHGGLPVAIDLLVDAGLSAAQVLGAATATAARVCGVGDRKGRLAAGYHADVLVVDGDPLRDIGSAVRRVAAVYAGGTRVAVATGAPLT